MFASRDCSYGLRTREVREQVAELPRNMPETSRLEMVATSFGAHGDSGGTSTVRHHGSAARAHRAFARSLLSPLGADVRRTQRLPLFGRMTC